MAFSTDPAWDRQYHLYKSWRSDNHYTKKSGVFVIPLALSDAEIAAGEDPVAFVQAFAGYSERLMEWSTKRTAGPPVIPKPDDSGPFVFLEGQISFAGPSVGPNGDTFDWTVGGTYLYIQSVSSEATDGYALTGFPFPLNLQYDNAQYVAQGATALSSGLGIDALAGHTASQTLQPTSPYWAYTCPTYFPAVLQNADLAIGGLPPPV